MDAYADAGIELGRYRAIDADGAERMLRQRWGNDYNANMGLVAAGLKKLGGPDGAVGHYLDATGLGNDPAILLTLAQHGRGTLSMDKTAAVQRRGELMKSDAFKRGDRETVAEVRTLAPIVYGKGP